MPNIGKDMRSCVTILFSLIAVLIGHTAAAAADGLGTVLLHGKGGSPSGYIHELASVLQSKGYLVSTPTMPWSQNRIYDASFGSIALAVNGWFFWFAWKAKSYLVKLRARIEAGG